VAGQAPAVPLLREVGAVGGQGLAPEELRRHTVPRRGAPQEVRPEDAVVAPAVQVPPGEERAGVRAADLLTEAGDPDERAHLLRREARALRSGQHDAPPSPVVGGDHGVGGRAHPPRRPPAPAGGGDRPRVDGRDGVSNSSTPSMKNGRFSGKKRAKRLLTAICATSDSTCEKSGLIVASTVFPAEGCHFTSTPTSPVRSGSPKRRAGRAGDGHVLAARVRGEDEPARGGEAREAEEGLGVADQAVRAAGDRPAVEEIAELAGVVAPDEDPPLLLVPPRVAQRGERDPHLGRPAEVGDPGGSVVEEVRGEVLVLRGVVVDGVGLLAGGVDAQLDRGQPVAARVEEHGHVVVGAHDVVPLDEGRADARGVGVVAAHGHVEVAIVVGDPDGGGARGATLSPGCVSQNRSMTAAPRQPGSERSPSRRIAPAARRTVRGGAGSAAAAAAARRTRTAGRAASTPGICQSSTQSRRQTLQRRAGGDEGSRAELGNGDQPSTR
jgi:hypothetical protein